MCAVPPRQRPPQGAAAQEPPDALARRGPSPARRPGCAGYALAPAAARRRSRWVFRKKMEIHMPNHRCIATS